MSIHPIAKDTGVLDILIKVYAFEITYNLKVVCYLLL